MSIFGGNYTGSTLTPPVFEGYSCERNGDLIAIQEGYEDQLAIIEAIHTLDMAELNLRSEVKQLTESAAIEAKETEFEAVYESAVTNVFGKIKAFLMKMWGKLQAFFRSVLRFFDGLFKSGKDFVTKYEKDLRKLDLNGYEYKMFNYSDLDNDPKATDLFSIAENGLNDVQANATADSGKIEAAIKKIEEDRDSIIEKLRGSFVGAGNLEADEYSEKLYAKFRSGATDNSDMDDVKVNIGQIISTLQNSKALKNVEAAITDCNKVFDKKIKAIGKNENDFSKNSVAKDKTEDQKKHAGLLVSLSQKEASLFSEAKNVALDYFRAWKEAVVERDRVYKAVCTHAFRYKKEK